MNSFVVFQTSFNRFSVSFYKLHVYVSRIVLNSLVQRSICHGKKVQIKHDQSRGIGKFANELFFDAEKKQVRNYTNYQYRYNFHEICLDNQNFSLNKNKDVYILSHDFSFFYIKNILFLNALYKAESR